MSAGATSVPEAGLPYRFSVGQYHRLIEAGIDYFIIYVPGVAYDQEPLHRFESEVIPQIAAATPVHSITG